VTRRRRFKAPYHPTGGATRHPNSLANLKRTAGPGRPPTHGGYSVVARGRLDTKIAELYDVLAADAPLRDADGELPRHDAVVVRLMATALARLEDVEAHIRDCGWRDPKTGNEKPVLHREAELRREVFGYVEAMGMSPRSRAKLGLDLVSGVSHEERLRAYVAERYGNGAP
jgi:hypothetical protein